MGPAQSLVLKLVLTPIFLMLAVLLEPDGIVIALTIVVPVALAVQVLSLTVGRRFGFA